MSDFLSSFAKRLLNVGRAGVCGGLLIATSLVAGDGFRIGTCDWTLRMAGELRAFDFAQDAELDGLRRVADYGRLLAAGLGP